MTEKDNLRNRIADVVYETLNIWEPLGEDDESSFVAQAIIDELGLHYVDSEEYAQVGLDWIEVEKGRHVVGKWEQQ